jgi:hypothetical protein
MKTRKFTVTATIISEDKSENKTSVILMALDEKDAIKQAKPLLPSPDRIKNITVEKGDTRPLWRKISWLF